MLNDKYIYSEKELNALSKNDLLEIISIKTTDGVVIYFDTVNSVEFDEVQLKNGETLPIETEGAYDTLRSKFERYKLFSSIIDAKNNAGPLQLAEARFEEIMNEKIASLERQSQESIKFLEQAVNGAIDGINLKVEKGLEPIMTELSRTARELRVTVDFTIEKLEKKIKAVDSERFDRTLNKMSKIVDLMSEVIEETEE